MQQIDSTKYQHGEQVFAFGARSTPPPANAPSTNPWSVANGSAGSAPLGTQRDEEASSAQKEPENDDSGQEKKRIITARQYQMDFYRVRLF